jgi:glycolate oxidase iron-sulfur subunit
MASKNLGALEKMDADAVVTECGSCSAFLKDYPELFDDDPAKKELARRLTQKIQGFSEFMQTRFSESPPTKFLSGKVTYHDPCHMSRYQKVIKEPRALLRKIPGMNYIELPEADRCCGAAGSYNLMHYEQSMRVLDRKMEMVKKTGAEILTTECPGCIIQLSHGARRAGLGTRVVHLSELLREVM